MNAQAEEMEKFVKHNPEFNGKFIGYKASRGGLGISRIDDDWYECDYYLVELSDLKEALTERD